jgi:hypothetical protein
VAFGDGGRERVTAFALASLGGRLAGLLSGQPDRRATEGYEIELTTR